MSSILIGRSIKISNLHRSKQLPIFHYFPITGFSPCLEPWKTPLERPLAGSLLCTAWSFWRRYAPSADVLSQGRHRLFPIGDCSPCEVYACRLSANRGPRLPDASNTSAPRTRRVGHRFCWGRRGHCWVPCFPRGNAPPASHQATKAWIAVCLPRRATKRCDRPPRSCKDAEAALQNAEYPPTIDAADLLFAKAKWIKLKHSNRVPVYGRYRTPPQFNFGDVATLEDIQEYIGRNENGSL